MRTITLRTVAGRAIAALGFLAASAAAPAFAAPVTGPEADRIFALRLDAGYRFTDGDRLRLFPYQASGDGPTLGLDLLYLTPWFGTLRLDAGYLDEDIWQAQAEYNRGASFDIKVDSQAFIHAGEHLLPVPPVHVALPPPLSSLDVEGSDADPGRTYQEEFRESKAGIKLRVPGYPAHVRASGRVFTNRGDEQQRYFFRSCSTHTCHAKSRTRELDQVTREYSLGFDSHAGPVDLAYTHTAQTFREDAPDPVDAIGDLSGGLPAGAYAHDVNPDLRSFSDNLSLNTNLTNRVVLSAAYAGGEQENETSGVSRRTRTAGAALSWRPSSRAMLVGRYGYDEQRSGDLGAEALALRTRNNAAHASGTTHQHAVDPERTRHTAELAARLSPLPKLDIGARLRYRTLRRRSLLEKVGQEFVEDIGTMRGTLADLDGRYRPHPALALEASLGREWTDNPAYSLETTGITRYGLGGTWTPSPLFLARVSWQGYRGENDDADALQRAYAGNPALAAPERTVTGNAFSALAAFTPAPAFSLTGSWTLTDNAIEQDMIFGSVSNYGFSFLSSDTDWSGRYQIADVRARWAATRRLSLTAGATWVESLESYQPSFPEGAGLEEAGTVEFTKLLGSLEAEVRLTDAVGVSLAAFWARYDDQVEDVGDETSEGLLAAVEYRW